MAGPRKGEEGYEEYRKAYNARRNRRLQDPAFKAKEVARQRASKARLREQRKADAESRKAKQLELEFDEADHNVKEG